MIIYDPSTSSGQLIGVALTVAGVACCAAYSVITRRWIPDAKETSQVILAQQAHALVLALGSSFSSPWLVGRSRRPH